MCQPLLAGADGAPFLAKLAARLTACVSSAGASEQVWSSNDFIHSTKRNRLTAARAHDLVYVFCNMQIQLRLNDPKQFPEWVMELLPEEEVATQVCSSSMHMHAFPTGKPTFCRCCCTHVQQRASPFANSL